MYKDDVRRGTSYLWFKLLFQAIVNVLIQVGDVLFVNNTGYLLIRYGYVRYC